MKIVCNVITLQCLKNISKISSIYLFIFFQKRQPIRENTRSEENGNQKKRASQEEPEKRQINYGKKIFEIFCKVAKKSENMTFSLKIPIKF